MDRQQQLRMEIIGIVAGITFAAIGLFDTSDLIAPASMKTPLLGFASLLFLAAYLTAVIVRVGDQYSIWPWIRIDKA